MQPARLPTAAAVLPAPAVQALIAQAVEHFVAGRLDRARDLYLQALHRVPDDAVCHHHLGLIAHQRRNHAEAASLIGRAIDLEPGYAEACANQGAVLRSLGRYDEAIDILRRALATAPDLAQAHSNLGSIHEDQGRHEDALVAYRHAGMLNDKYTDAFVNAARLLRKLDRHPEALDVCSQIIASRPDAAAAYVALGEIMADLGRAAEAASALEQALRVQPDFAPALVARAALSFRTDDIRGAIENYRRLVETDPTNVPAHFALGVAYECLDDMAAALTWYRAAVALDPDQPAARVQIYHVRRHICDWDGLEAEEADLLAFLAGDTRPVTPFSIVSTKASAALQLRVAQSWGRHYETTAKPFVHVPAQAAARDGRRLRIAYLSSDFCSHATANLMAELFERHDRTRFEVFAYSYGADDRSEMRARLGAAFDHFVDVQALSTTAAAARIHADSIDILIELKGFTRGERLQIAAMRPAPIQVSFLGFPGTMGAHFLDYVLADPFVLPMDQQPFYAERIVHLPDCYQPNDSRRVISPMVPTRSACGLPDRGFVFCCFNNTYKITPPLFDIWMRLLGAVPGSVLWLFDANNIVKNNLRAAAMARGIDPARLVFAPRTNKPDHLARQRLADLFLDTLPYNAHTTTSDALWTGLPVVTCAGTTFAGRVAGSLLHAVGLPELVTHTLEDYETLALALATTPERLAAIRQKLAVNRLSAPLFDTPRFARNIEAAFDRMWSIYADGEAPQSFAVQPITGAAKAPALASAAPARIPYAACPVCGGTDTEPALGAGVTGHRLYRAGMAPHVAWHVCASCTHVFTEGHFDDATRAAFAADALPGDTVGHDMEVRRPQAVRAVARVARHVASGAWLDVGFGDGSLLFAAAEWGFEPVGLDARDAAVADLRTLGCPAYAASLLAVPADVRFAVISLSGGLHREPFPREILRAAHARLETDGVLVLTMPNSDTMVWRMLHASGAIPHWSAIDHYHHFSRKGLDALLRAEGFCPVGYDVDETYRSGMELIARKI